MAEEEINSAIESLKKLSTKLERIDFGILRENSNIVSNALEKFGKTIPKLIEEFNEAIQVERFKEAANLIIAIFDKQ